MLLGDGHLRKHETKPTKHPLARLKKHFAGLNAFQRHKQMINNYFLYYPGAHEKLKERDTSKDKNDYDIIRENHKFLWNADDITEAEKSWDAKLAKRYYDKLFKEYCIADLTFYEKNKVAMRWRIEREVKSGKGQFICGEKHCDKDKGLESWEVNFTYKEHGEKKNALVKLRLCPACSAKLNYHSMKKRVSKEKRESRKRHKKTKEKSKKKSKKEGAEDESESSSSDSNEEEDETETQEEKDKNESEIKEKKESRKRQKKTKQKSKKKSKKEGAEDESESSSSDSNEEEDETEAQEEKDKNESEMSQKAREEAKIAEEASKVWSRDPFAEKTQEEAMDEFLDDLLF
uniref:Protein FRA10AC1 n=2 Tax=Panagrolaimus sp. ES5 TaxID=591445 RepID=A0AC34FZ89_9BILA